MTMYFFGVLSTFLLISITDACSVGGDWESQSIEERASKPQWVVYGRVVSDQYPAPVPDGNVDHEYWVVVQPLCWLKRGPEVPFLTSDRMRRESEGETNTNDTDHYVEFENITVTEDAPCVRNDLMQGETYILFLSTGPSYSNFSTYDVNVEPGAFQDPSEETFEAVHRGIDAGLKGYPEGECLEGVEIPCFTGDRDPKVCNMGVAMGMALWFLVSAIALAVSVLI